MFVALNFAGGLQIDHNGQRIALNGANAGLSAVDLIANGSAPDSAVRFHGWGITEITDPAQIDALTDWMDVTGSGPGPVSAGVLEVFDKRADAEKEVSKRAGKQKSGLEGLDPEAELKAAGLEKAEKEA